MTVTLSIPGDEVEARRAPDGPLPGHTGILLINLGSPQAPRYWPVRRYLKEFLSDPRVIEARGPLWWLILHGLILTRRPRSLARAYRRIWDQQTGQSPLKIITASQASRLGRSLGNGFENSNVTVDWAMRYGTPTIGSGIDRLIAAGAERIVLFPLYPQYSAATTASVFDDAFAHLQTLRHQPALRCVAPYFAHPAYVRALADSVSGHIETLGWQPEVVLASFHGLPREMIARGDPYLDHCRTTFRLLRTALGLAEDRFRMTFQSNSGRGRWLAPSTEDTIRDLAAGGVRDLVVVTPGFAADCLETLEEIGLGARRAFHASGGHRFSLVPCLNAGSDAVALLRAIVQEELAPMAARA